MTRQSFYQKWVSTGILEEMLKDLMGTGKRFVYNKVNAKDPSPYMPSLLELQGVTIDEVMSKTKKRRISDARFVIWRFMCDECGIRPTHIAKKYNRSTPAITSGIKQAKTIPSLQKKYSELFDYLKTNI